jgi:aspartyl-tRNA(Asn)/glutamyl-tRNA(Gln) amidotransferase subunit A
VEAPVSALAWSSIAELGAALRARRISSLELARLFLDRLERHGEALGAVVTVTRSLAEEQARRADAEIAAGRWRGPLHGIPFGVKDLLATAGIPTTWGAEPYRSQTFDYDATVIRRLRDAGAVLCAKLAMVELAGGFGYNNPDASFTGPGRTPWNTAFWSGGSSSGPGAAVAAGLVPFAIGSETSGSILTPSAFSGVTGFRPTYGVVSRHGAMALCWTLDKLGPMARSAEDCRLVMEAIAGSDPADPTTIEEKIDWNAAGPRKLRIATVRGTTGKVQPEVRANFLRSIDVLRSLGHEVVEIDYPDLPYSVMSVIVDAEGASAFEDLLVSGKAKQLRALADRTGGYEAAATLAIDYLRAMRIRTRIHRAMLELFERVDVVAGPTRATVAYPIGSDFADAYPGISGGPPLIPSMNLAGAPAISLPNGFGEAGLPTAIQLNAAPLHDAALLALGTAYQKRDTGHLERPPGFD